MKSGNKTVVRSAARTVRGRNGPTEKSEERTQRGEATRQLLLDAAERMFAERGVEGVSMRQIGAAVGQGNFAVIQYYFDSKEGLVRAIIERRATELMSMRQAMLDDTKKAGKTTDTRSLLSILHLPIAKIKDENDRSIYANFMLQALKLLWGNARILHHSWEQEGPVKETIRLLAALNPHLNSDQLAMRILRINRLFVNAVVDWDRVREMGGSYDDEDFFLNDLLNMMTAAFEAPLPEREPAG